MTANLLAADIANRINDLALDSKQNAEQVILQLLLDYKKELLASIPEQERGMTKRIEDLFLCAKQTNWIEGNSLEQCWDFLCGRVEKLESYLDMTSDGVLLVEAKNLYCPQCGGEITENNKRPSCAFCWNCPNPDNENDVPLPLSYGLCLGKKPEKK